MGALLGLFWGLLREGRLKVARGRSWQPEIGMEHASRGRRSGNKGVGARWRGRFRIFSARHRSRTKVSHAENSGMTMLFFSLEVAPVSEGDSFTPSGAASHACRLRSGSTRGSGFFSGVSCSRRPGICCEGMCWPVDRPATHAAAGAAARGVRGDWGILSHTLERRGGFVAFPAFVRFLACGKGCVIMCFRDFPDCRR